VTSFFVMQAAAVIVSFLCLAFVSNSFASSNLPLLWGWTHFPRASKNPNPHSSIFTFDLVTGQQEQKHNSSIHILKGTYDYDRGLLYAIENSNNQLLQFDVKTGHHTVLGVGLPAGYQPSNYIVSTTMYYNSSTNTIYGEVWNSNLVQYAVWKTALGSSSVEPVIIAENYVGGPSARGSAGFDLDGDGNYVTSNRFGQVIRMNLETAVFTSTEFPAANNSVGALWWWDAPRSRMLVFLEEQVLSFVEVNMHNMSIVQVIAEYPMFRKSLVHFDAYAYDVQSDLLWIKGEGNWHADYRNMTYVAIDPANGNVVSQFVIEKQKGGGQPWVYSGARITNEVVAFFGHHSLRSLL